MDDFGRPTLIDRATGKQISTDELRAAATEAEPGETVDIAAGLGVSGTFYRALNTLVGLFGGGLVSEDAEKATNALEQLRIETIGVGEAKIPGRPSNFQLQLIDTLTVNPRSILTGDARALQKLKDTRGFLQREVDRMNDEVLANPRRHAPKELRETADNLGKMSALVRQYNWAIDNMETRSGKTLQQIYDENQ